LFLVELEPDRSQALLIELPSGEEIRQGLAGEGPPSKRRRDP
jgi:hypothetical protein